MPSAPKNKPARPPVHNVEVVAVDIDGRRASWDSGRNRFRGDPEVVAFARDAAQYGYDVVWGGCPPHTAGDTDALSALHALVAFDDGRAAVTEWPDWVSTWWDENHWGCLAERHEIEMSA